MKAQTCDGNISTVYSYDTVTTFIILQFITAKQTDFDKWTESWKKDTFLAQTELMASASLYHQEVQCNAHLYPENK